jgi:Protein of unknown function (DUF4231)
MPSPDLEKVQQAAERYMSGVVEPSITYYERQGNRNRVFFNGSRVLIILFSLVLPAFSAVTAESAFHPVASVALIGLPIGIALLASLDGFFRYGELWRSRISTALALRRFKRQFEADAVEVTLLPPERQAQGAFQAYKTLMKLVEGAMAGEEREFWEKRIRELREQLPASSTLASSGPTNAAT